MFEMKNFKKKAQKNHLIEDIYAFTTLSDDTIPSVFLVGENGELIEFVKDCEVPCVYSLECDTIEDAIASIAEEEYRDMIVTKVFESPEEYKMSFEVL